MNKLEISQVLIGGISTSLDKMYEYGYACGLNNSINFSEIKRSLAQVLPESEINKCLHLIIDGFRNASEFDTNVFFG